jgi:hypothetical protein
MRFGFLDPLGKVCLPGAAGAVTVLIQDVSDARQISFKVESDARVGQGKIEDPAWPEDSDHFP